MENKTGKIMIEASQDNRLEVAMEIAKSLNNLTDLLKNMSVSVSNIHINGCNIQTAQGETAIYMGNNVKNTLVSNCVVDTSGHPNAAIVNQFYEQDENDCFDNHENVEEDDFEEDDTYEESVETFEEDDDDYEE